MQQLADSLFSGSLRLVLVYVLDKTGKVILWKSQQYYCQSGLPEQMLSNDWITHYVDTQSHFFRLVVPHKGFLMQCFQAWILAENMVSFYSAQNISPEAEPHKASSVLQTHTSYYSCPHITVNIFILDISCYLSWPWSKNESCKIHFGVQAKENLYIHFFCCRAVQKT